MFNTILGLMIIFFGIVSGLYVGVWFLFVGGIVQVINAIKMNPVDAIDIVLGILRVASASIVGILIGAIFTGIGATIIDN